MIGCMKKIAQEYVYKDGRGKRRVIVRRNLHRGNRIEEISLSKFHRRSCV